MLYKKYGKKEQEAHWDMCSSSGTSSVKYNSGVPDLLIGKIRR